MKFRNSLTAIVAAMAVTGVVGLGSPAYAGNIIDEWANAKMPPAPTLKQVTVDPKTTALLMLDFVPSACNMKRRPRCVDSVKPVAKLLAEARGKKMMVVFTAYGKLAKKDVLHELAPKENEPFVVSLLDKYRATNLEKMLKDKGIQTLIIVGTAAHGAVISTASASA